MSKNTDYKIKNVTVSTNGRDEIYFDVEWEGDENLDYFELRIREGSTDNSLELYAYPAHQQRVVVKDFYFIKSWKSKQVNNETFYVELGIADYTEKGELKSWKVLASYEPIFVNIYHEYHMFHKNVLEIREAKKDSPRRKSEEYREAYLNACRVIVAGSRGFFEYDLMSRELDKLFNESKEFTGCNIKIISGMADDADSLAIRYADERKLTKILFPANWKRFSRVAGFLRNEDMLSVATHLVVFWDGKSSGTNHMIEIAKAKGIPVWGLKHPCASCFGDFRLERW